MYERVALINEVKAKFVWLYLSCSMNK